MTSANGYDLGGSEYPAEGLIVVDVQQPDWDDLPPEAPREYIEQDLRQDFSYLPPTDYINVSKFLRYLSNDCGYLSGDPIGWENQETFAERLYKIVKQGGKIRLFDHMEVMTSVISRLVQLGCNIDLVDFINLADQDLPCEWVVVLIKPTEE